MTAIIGLLVLCGIFLLIFLYCRGFLNSWDRKRAKEIEKGTYYDERQIVSHGKANACAAGVTVIYYMLVYLLLAAWEEKSFELLILPSGLVKAGILMMVVSYELSCLLTDSVVPLGNYSFPTGWYLVGGGIIVLGEVWGSFLVDMDSGDWENLIIGFALLAMGVIHRIAYLRNKRESE